MRVIKSLLLGAAAGLVATAGVQAADLPVKAKPVEYVKICSAYGAGFYYIPGTDICLKVGGAVRADYYHNAPGAFPDITSLNDRAEETHGLRGRGYIILDARNNTAYGTLRAFLNMYMTWDTSSTNLGQGDSTINAGGTPRPFSDRAFIQFAGFTFGHAQSFYDFWSSTGPIANLVNWASMSTGATGWNVLAYTAQFGNGVSGTLSMEDQRRRVVVTAAPVFGTVSVRAGQLLPALVGNLRVDQSWGSAQIMGAVQELRVTDAAGGSALDTYGYAVGGGFTWNNPSAPGSMFGIQASWASGANGYTAGATYGAHRILDGAAGNAGATGFLADAVVTGGVLHKTDSWAVDAGYQHRFNPNWAWSLHGAYASIDYDATVDALCGAAANACSFDFWSLGSRLLWTPVPGLDIGLDVLYHRFGTQTGAAPAAAATIAAANLRSNDVWAAMLRVQRNF